MITTRWTRIFGGAGSLRFHLVGPGGSGSIPLFLPWELYNSVSPHHTVLFKQDLYGSFQKSISFRTKSLRRAFRFSALLLIWLSFGCPVLLFFGPLFAKPPRAPGGCLATLGASPCISSIHDFVVLSTVSHLHVPD